MADTRKNPAQLDAGIIARKGEARPADGTQRAGERSQPLPVPRGTKNTIAVTVRLDEERYRKLIAYGAQFFPRRTNQEILVEALDAYLAILRGRDGRSEEGVSGCGHRSFPFVSCSGLDTYGAE